jgi:hypothetical protein
MIPLEPEEMHDSRTAPNKAQLALAAGRHPNGNIMFITGDGTIHEIDCQKQGDLPKGAVYPIDNGLTIVILHPGHKPFEIATDWALENSSTLLSAGVMVATTKGRRITYVDE